MITHVTSTITTNIYSMSFDGIEAKPSIQYGTTADPIKLKFVPIRIANNTFKPDIGGKYAIFGCQKVSRTEIQAIIDQLLGVELGKIKVIRKKGSKIHLKSTLLEETDSYYIMDTHRAFPKTEYEQVEINDKHRALKEEKLYNSGKRFTFRGYNIGSTSDSSKLELIEKLEYVLEVLDVAAILNKGGDPMTKDSE